jgi:hypothetical protein
MNDTNILGLPDVNVAIGNPLKGLAGGPRWSQQSPLPNSVPSSIEFYNIALDEVMLGDNQFNWAHTHTLPGTQALLELKRSYFDVAMFQLFDLFNNSCA